MDPYEKRQTEANARTRAESETEHSRSRSVMDLKTLFLLVVVGYLEPG